jgi:UDP:flavonoid glycosyltransferase YjiC (YdhE family)
VRILFTFIGGRGHFEPLAPIARAAAAAGHTVAFACPGLQRATVEAAGFEAFAVAPVREPPARKPLVAVDVEREERVVREVLLGSAARERTPATLALCECWRPDVLVCDEVDAGSMVAAERLGVPYATVLENASGSFMRPQLMAEPTDALRAEHGLPPGPGHALLLSPFPPSFRDPPAGAVSLRPAVAAGPVPEWLAGVDGAVLFTLGTVFNLEAGDLFTRVLAGLRSLDADVIVTVGREIDPAELGPQPPHVRVERYVALAAALPHCAAVVSHGGSGLVAGTLAHGLPSVLLPMGADQPGNAARCEALGLARVLDVMTATPADVHQAVTAVLTEPSYREAAERLRDEIEELPGPDHAIAHLITLGT